MKRTKVKITKAMVARATTTNKRGELVARDSEVPGLELWCHAPSERTGVARKAWKLYYRVDGKQRRPVLGDATAMLPDDARKLARELLGDVARGKDPSEERTARRTAPTMKDLADRYLEEHARPTKKPSSVAFDERNLRKHVLPRLASRKVASIIFKDITKLHRAMRETPVAANRTVALLSKIFNLAEKWGLRPLNSNPCRHVTRYREQRKHRDLSELELARLAKVLREWPTMPHKPAMDSKGKRVKHSRTDKSLPLTVEETAVREQACDVIRLLLFTGLRRGEAFNLRWGEADLDRGLLRLADSKTGQKVVALNSAAQEVLERQERLPLNDLVFPSRRKGRGHGRLLHDLKNAWGEVRSLAGLGDMRIHDLRHNFASFGVSGGVALPVVGRLLGHQHASTTQRYADVFDDPARRAAELIGQALTRAMGETSLDEGSRQAGRGKP